MRNDELSWRELTSKLAREGFDNVVISPGPGTPTLASDAGKSRHESRKSISLRAETAGMMDLDAVYNSLIGPGRCRRLQRAAGRSRGYTHIGRVLWHASPRTCPWRTCPEGTGAHPRPPQRNRAQWPPPLCWNPIRYPFSQINETGQDLHDNHSQDMSTRRRHCEHANLTLQGQAMALM